MIVIAGAHFSVVVKDKALHVVRRLRPKMISKILPHHPMVLYDTETKRSWPVPEFHIISHMAQTYLDSVDFHKQNHALPTSSLEEVSLEIFTTSETLRDRQLAERRTRIGENVLARYKYGDVNNGNVMLRSKEIKIQHRPPWWDFREKCLVQFSVHLGPQLLTKGML